jgi:capsular polysaccharide biosynthesis protein
MGVNTVYRVMCKKIGRAYCDERDHDAGPPIYLSKTRLTSGVGRFVGEQEVVDILERDGVQIVYPEELTVSEQIQLISRSRVVAGTSGSALHTSIFSAFGRRIIALNQNDDVNSNFVMIDRLVGNSASYYFAPQSRSKKGSSFLTDHTLEDPAKVGSSLLRIIREQD